MSALTNTMEDNIILWLFRGVAYTPPTTVYIALHTADPGETGSLADEVTGGSYARVAVVTSPTGSSEFTDLTGTTPGAVENTNTLTWPTATADWGTITHVSICDAASGGNALWKGALAQAKTVSSGDTFKINSGALDLSMS